MKSIDLPFNSEVIMTGEMNWVYPVGVGALLTLFLLFLNNRVAVPVRQKNRRGTRRDRTGF